MIRLILLTGFLGSGKTTLIKRILDDYSDSRVGVIINEFGSVNIDAKLVRKDGIEMAELSNGSIFCACIKDKFVESLVEMSKRDLEYLFIEASGLADPASMSGIIKGLDHVLTHKYDYIHSLCIVDGSSFLDLSEILVALKRQVEFSDYIIINKADIMSSEDFREICEIVAGINPKAVIEKATYCDIPVRDIISSPSGLGGRNAESTNSYTSRPQSLVVRQTETLNINDLRAFLEEIASSTYRIKGFLNTDDGPIEVSCVGMQIDINPWNEPVLDPRIVVISSVGIKIVSVLCDSIDKHAQGLLSL